MHPLEGHSDEPRRFDGLLRRVVTDPPAFGGPVERVDLAPEFFEELPGQSRIQKRPSRNAEAQAFRKGFGGKQSPEHGRHGRENCRPGHPQPALDRAGERVLRHHEADPAAEQRGRKIAEAVGVSQSDDPVVQIVRANPHRRANLIAVGEQLLCGKSDGFRQSRGARGEFIQADAAARRFFRPPITRFEGDHPIGGRHPESHPELLLDL